MSQETKDVIQTEAVEEEKTEVVDKDTAAMPPPAEKAIDIERKEEKKLKAKFPQFQGHLGGGQSGFHKKRLGTGRIYFDSGDYEMAKQRDSRGKAGPKRGQLRRSIGEDQTQPNPDSSVPDSKNSIIQGELLSTTQI